LQVACGDPPGPTPTGDYRPSLRSPWPAAVENLDSVAPEACYYTGIDYCIRHGLTHFEPGAQGEHKVGRGFEPVETHSVHWLSDDVFSRAVAEFVEGERKLVHDYMAAMNDHLRYRKDGTHA